MEAAMRRLLIAAAAVLAFMGQAAAVEMPRHLIGSWCATNVAGVYVFNPESCPSELNSLAVDRKEINIWDGTTSSECQLLQLTKIKRRTYRVAFACTEKRVALDQLWELTKDMLTVTPVKPYLIYPNPPIYPKDRSD
jgi:hypothetical protein